MFAGFEVWSKFETYGLSQDEYDALCERMLFIKQVSTSHIESLLAEGSIALEDVELDLTVGYFTQNNKEERLTPWFLHQCGISTFPKVSINPVVENALRNASHGRDLCSSYDCIQDVLSNLEIIIELSRLLSYATMEQDCIYSMHIIDLCIVNIIRSVNICRLRYGL